MQQNVSSSKVIKQWEVLHEQLIVTVTRPGITIVCSRSIRGASPAYLESMIERLNIHVNNLLYELGRIPR